jgi:alkanesulfonate monooxygenase SsuD/methylene tetrahydromethanopterin reductase-like flavin-dependent oxidoreductase (luciferase family)
MVFGQGGPLDGMVRRRRALDAALTAAGRDAAEVGILWDLQFIIAETEDEARRKREQMGAALPREAAGAYLSHNAGFDFSTLPERFVLGDLARRIAAGNASPVGLVHRLSLERGADAVMTRTEFFEIGWRAATGYDHTLFGTAQQVADQLEEIFAATGERGGFMLAHPQATPRALLDVVDFLVPELQRRGRFRRRYEGETLRENLGIPTPRDHDAWRMRPPAAVAV